MTIRYYSWNPPHWVQASGEVGGQRFLLSAVRGEHGMDLTIRCATNLMAPIKTPLPSDIERYELEAIVEILVAALVVELEDAAA